MFSARRASVFFAALPMLSACNSNSDSSSSSAVWEGSSGVPLASDFETTQVSGSETTGTAIADSSNTAAMANNPNRAPTIVGTPQTAALAGAAYSYQPVAWDTDGDALIFSIAGMPAWARFDATSGRLAGMPAPVNAGTYAGIVISVSDGKTVVSQAAFSISVISYGTAMLTWQPPSQNTDLSPISGLAGYRVYHGTRADALTDIRQIFSPNISSYWFEALESGRHFFAVSSYTADGLESALSAIVSKDVP